MHTKEWKKRGYRVLSLFLVLILFVGLFPVTVLAKENTAKATSRSSYPMVTMNNLMQWGKEFSIRNPTDGKTYKITKGESIPQILVDGVPVYCLQLGARARTWSAQLEGNGVAGSAYWRKLGNDRQELIALTCALSDNMDYDAAYMARSVIIWEITLGYRDLTTGKIQNSSLSRNIASGRISNADFQAAYQAISDRLIAYKMSPSFGDTTANVSESRWISVKKDENGIWYAELKDSTGTYTNIDLNALNSSAAAQALQVTFSQVEGGLKAVFAAEPTEESLKTALRFDKVESQQILAYNGEKAIVWADKGDPQCQILVGHPNGDPTPFYLKFTKEETPPPPPPDEEVPPRKVKKTVEGHKYGEYDDAGGLGGASIDVYRIDKETGERKKVKTVQSDSDGSFRYSYSYQVKKDEEGNEIDEDPCEFEFEETPGTYAKGGGYEYNGKRVSNYLSTEAGSGDVDGTDLYNYQQHGRITVEKQDRQTGTTAQGDGSLAGAKFVIGTVDGYDDKGRPYGMAVQTLTTGADGRATSSALREGIRYYIMETNAPTGYLLYTDGNGPWYKEFAIEFDGDHDNEITTQYTVYWDSGDTTGTQSSAPLLCTNKIKEGYLHIYKFLQKDPDGNPFDEDEQSKHPAAGIPFDIYLASETPRVKNPGALPDDAETLYQFRQAADGHILSDAEMAANPYQAQGLKDTVVTNKDGEATSKRLPYGKYVIVERNPMTGYDRPMVFEQWIDTKVKWNASTKEFVPVLGGDGLGNDNGYGLEHNPPTSDPVVSADEIKQMKVLKDIAENNDYADADYGDYLTRDHFEQAKIFYASYVSTPHYVDKKGNEYDPFGNLYDEEILQQGGRVMTAAEAKSAAESITKTLLYNYHAQDVEILGGGAEDAGDVYAQHLDEYNAAHHTNLQTVDMLTYPLYIENQTTKRYLRIVKLDADSNKLVPLNDFYFKVWDCTRQRWVQDNRNSATLAPNDVWQTNSKGEAVGTHGEDLGGTANLVDFLEYGSAGYDIYEVHTHAGYYLSDKPIHFYFQGEGTDGVPLGTPIVVEFSNKPVLGNATLHKTGDGLIDVSTDEGETTKPEYGEVNLEGAIYGVYAAEDIRAQDEDHTVRTNRNKVLKKTYTVDTKYGNTRQITFTYADKLMKDSLIETIQTGPDGLAKTTDLYCGKYYLKELYSPVGYVLSPEKLDFEIKDTHHIPFNQNDVHLNPHTPSGSRPDSQITEENLNYQPEKERLGKVEPAQPPTLAPREMVAVSAHDERQTAEISLLKRLVLPVHPDELDWTGTQVKIYAGQDFEEEGTVVTSKGTLVDTITTDSREVETAALPFGLYYAVLTKIPPEVDLVTEKHEFLIEKPKEEDPPEGEPEESQSSESLLAESGSKEHTEGTEEGTVSEATESTPTESIPPESGSGETPQEPTAAPGKLDLGGAFRFTWKTEVEQDHLADVPDEALKDITFGLYTNEDILSAENGMVLLPKDTLLYVFHFDEQGHADNTLYDENGNPVGLGVDIPVGKYYVKELSTVDGYLLNSETFELRFYPCQDGQKPQQTIPITTEKQPLLNRPYDVEPPAPPEPEPPPEEPEEPDKPDKPHTHPPEGGIQLSKTDVATGKPVPNAGMRIRDSDGDIIAEGRTDEKGNVTFSSLPKGNYTYQEFDAPPGYVLDETPHPFVIRENGEIVKAAMTNELQTGQLILLKTMEGRDTGALEGVAFRIAGTAQNSVSYDQTHTTDKDGKIAVLLPIGSYTVVELAGEKNTGYLLSPDQAIEITREGKTLEIHNTQIRGWLELIKTDRETGQLLPNATYGVYDGENKLVRKLTTNTEGHAKIDLPYGKYVVRELEAPEGYQMDDKEYPAEIMQDGQLVKLDLQDTKIPATPTIPTTPTEQPPKTGEGNHLPWILAVLGGSVGTLAAWWTIVWRKKRSRKKGG